MISALVASPRKNGYSWFLLNKIIESIPEQVDIFDLFELDIKPCTACEYCFKNTNCVKSDDMQILYKHLQDSDFIILASPIYFYSPPSVLKILIDRTQMIWAKKHIHKVNLKSKKAGIITVAGEETKKYPNMVKTHDTIINIWLKTINAEPVFNILAENTVRLSKEEIYKKLEKELEHARQVIRKTYKNNK